MTMSAAERQANWRQRNPGAAAARVAASQAKRPEHYRELHRQAGAAYRSRQREHAALVAAAAEVTALWASYDTQRWIDVDGFSDAIARLAALVGETGQ